MRIIMNRNEFSMMSMIRLILRMFFSRRMGLSLSHL